MERLAGLVYFLYLCIIETHAVKSATILPKEKATRKLIILLKNIIYGKQNDHNW